MSSTKQYAERDARALDKEGGYFSRHMDAMTEEGLHGKCEIALELAWRDQVIDNLNRRASKAYTAGCRNEREVCVREATVDWPAAGIGGCWPFGAGDPRGTQLKGSA